MTCCAGNSGNFLDRNAVDENDMVPGDWGYIYNDAHQLHIWNDKSGNPWAFGLEGENIIFAGQMGFWGHFGPGNTYFQFDNWMKDVGSWRSRNGERSKPRFGNIVVCPNIGIEKIEEKQCCYELRFFLFGS